MTRWVTLAVGLAAAIWGLLIIQADGGQVHLLGLKLSSRHPFLLFWGGLALLGLYAWLWQPAVGRQVAALATLSKRRAGVAAAAIALTVFAVSIHWGSPVAGGADSHGYVSQAGLWRHGDLLIRGDIIRQSPWPLAVRTWAPLGYQPAAGRNDAIAPLYPPGFPLLMALFQLVFGYCGAFYVVPICSAGLVGLTYVLGVGAFGRPTPAFWAALLVATSPVFLFQSLNPMTDVPAAAVWALVLVLLVADWPLTAGFSMAIALAIRPNLVAVAVAVFVWVALTDWRAWRTAGRAPTRTLRLAVGVAPAVIGVAWFNDYLYGSPFISGYGGLDYLYSSGHLRTNVSQFTTWMAETQTPIVALSLLYFVVPLWLGDARIRFPRVLFGSVLLAVVVSYLFYIPFDTWTYLRFLLPMWPVLMLLTALALDQAVKRWPSTASRLLALACVVLVSWWGVRTAVARGTFDLWRGERRYVDVARYIASHTEPRAVIISFQHSGSIRHYADRLTMRWDQLGPGWLDRAVEYLASTGRHPYIVVDGEEAALFRKLFQPLNRLGALDWVPAAVLDRPPVAVYDAVNRNIERPAIIAGTGGGPAGWRCDLPQRPAPRTTLEAP